MRTRTWQTILLIFAGIVIGSLVANLSKTVASLSFLSFGLDFGISNPVVINLGVMSITFGFSVYITVATVIFTALTVYFGRKIFK